MISPVFDRVLDPLMQLADCLGIDGLFLVKTAAAMHVVHGFDNATGKFDWSLADRWAEVLHATLERHLAAFTTGGTIIDPKCTRRRIRYANKLTQALSLIYTDTVVPLPDRTATARYAAHGYLHTLITHGEVAADQYGFDVVLGYGMKRTVPAPPPLPTFPDTDGSVA